MDWDFERRAGAAEDGELGDGLFGPNRGGHVYRVDLVHVELVGALQEQLAIEDRLAEHFDVELLVPDGDGHAARDRESARPVSSLRPRVDELDEYIARLALDRHTHLLRPSRHQLCVGRHLELDHGRLEAGAAQPTEGARHEHGLWLPRARAAD